MYKVYLFDLYGTLVDIKTDEQSTDVWRKLAVFYGYYGADYTAKELQEYYLLEEAKMRETAFQKLADDDRTECYPEIVLEYVFQKLFARKGVDASYELSVHAGQFFRILSLQYIKLYPGIEAMLQTLKAANKKIYLLSNAQQIFTKYEMAFLDIKKYFDGILFSSDAGFMKPDIRFYQKAIRQFGITPAEALMIGNDYVCDIQGANAAGLEAFYVHTNLSPAMPEGLEDNMWMQGMDGRELVERMGFNIEE